VSTNTATANRVKTLLQPYLIENATATRERKLNPRHYFLASLLQGYAVETMTDVPWEACPMTRLPADTDVDVSDARVAGTDYRQG
jgi:hypothetical protein